MVPLSSGGSERNGGGGGASSSSSRFSSTGLNNTGNGNGNGNGNANGNASGASGTGGVLSTIRDVLSPSQPSSLLADLAPQVLQSRILHHPSFNPSSASASSSLTGRAISNSLLDSGRFLAWPIIAGRRQPRDALSLSIRERVDDLLALDVPPAPFDLSPPSSSSSSFPRRIAPTSSSNPAAAAETTPSTTAQITPPDAQVPLIRGFQATTPTAQIARVERRRRRAGLGELALGLEGGKLGLKERGDAARGLLGSADQQQPSTPPLPSSSNSNPFSSLGISHRATSSGTASVKRKRATRKSSNLKASSFAAGGGDDFSPDVQLSPEELTRDVQAVQQDMANISVRRALLNHEISSVESRIAELSAIRDDLADGLYGLREEELELEDELEGLREMIATQEQRERGQAATHASSRRRKGPAFLPSEHDELPTGVAFMTLNGHLAPITSLDFSEPYGVAVTASLDESVRLWDLTTGDELGFLRGHDGVVKTLQVESSMCITGGADGQIRIWDLDTAEAGFAAAATSSALSTPALDTASVNKPPPLFDSNPAQDVFFNGGAGTVNGPETVGDDDGLMREDPSNRDELQQNTGPCIQKLDGHTKAVTALYFDESCLVTGSSDKTLRQWDLQTGQCVLTMDILWAISNPQASQTLSSADPDEVLYGTRGASSMYYSTTTTPTSSPRRSSLGEFRRQNSSFMIPTQSSGPGMVPSSASLAASPTTTTYADGSWELYEDFVGSVQFWSHALVSGTGDGCVRMWDMRTGQAHRTLVGHTAPVTCVQFDEVHLVSGSLDKSIRIWDLRTGSISDTIRYDHPITALQFDSRKIIAAAGENAVRVFNRTTLQHSTLNVNGHTSPVERLRFMDRYLATGARDCTVKIWALP